MRNSLLVRNLEMVVKPSSGIKSRLQRKIIFATQYRSHHIKEVTPNYTRVSKFREIFAPKTKYTLL